MDICLKNLSKSFGDKPVLTELSARFPAGSVTCLMGPSGCGKTTLLNILMGLVPADSGEITGLPEKIAVVFQEDRLCGSFTPRANVRLVTGRRVPDREIDALLTRLGLGESLRQPVKELSGGMRRRVALARALLADGELLLLDEPFKGLDPDTRAAAAAVTREYARGRTVLFVTHDAAETALLGGTVLAMG